MGTRIASGRGIIVEGLESRRLLTVGPGRLDWAFGRVGTMTATAAADVTQGLGSAADVAVLAGNRFLTVGDDGNGNDWGIALIYADNVMDESFGSHGLVFTDFGLNKPDHARCVRVFDSGDFVVAGTMTGRSGRLLYALAKYHADGTLDSTFGRGGKVVTDTGTAAIVTDLYLQADGKIMMGGGAFVLRYNPDGSLDTSFDGDGILAAPNTKGVAMDAAGRVLTFEETDTTGTIHRFNTDGSPDDTFAANGAVVLSRPIMTWDGMVTGDIAIAPDGKIVVSTSITPPLSDQQQWLPPAMALFRYNADGTPDASFGDGGVAYFDDHSSESWGSAIVIQPDGKIIQGAYPWALVRYNQDGIRDTSYAGDEYYSYAAHNMTLTSDYGRLVFPAGSLGATILTSDTSPYTPHIFHYAAYDIDTENHIVTIKGSDGDDIIRIADETIYISVIVNDWDHNYIFNDGEVVQFVINGGAGNDLIVIGGGYGFGDLPPAFVNGGDGNDTIVGSDANDTLNGNAGKDSINGGGGNDRVAGNGGHDALVGNIGDDRLYGDFGNDKLEAGSGNDRAYGGDGDDILAGGAGSDTLYGGDGANTIVGGGGNDKAYEISLTDQLFGITTQTWSHTSIAPLSLALSRADALVVTQRDDDPLAALITV